MPTVTISKAERDLAKASDALQELQPRVTNQMKCSVAVNLNVTPRTIDTYLAGKGKKLAFALQLLKKLRVVAE